MDQQQLSMIVLALIAITIYVSLSRSNAIYGKRDILIQEISTNGNFMTADPEEYIVQITGTGSEGVTANEFYTIVSN
jgi:type II secretory pathway component PulJ